MITIISRFLCLIFLIQFCTLNLRAQTTSPQYKIESLGNNKGLNSSNIFALHQDRDGFIWVGTSLGISKFDGYTFQNYSQAVHSNIGKINSIAEDSTGTLWIGGDRGLFLVENGKVFSTKLGDFSIQVLHFDRQGELWVGGLGFIPFRLSFSDRQKLKSQQSVTITSIVSDQEWAKKIVSKRVWDIDIDEAGTAWLGTDNRRASFDGDSLTIYWVDSTIIHRYNSVVGFHKDSIIWGSIQTPFLLQKNNHFYRLTRDAAYTIFVTDTSTYFLTTTPGLLELKDGIWKTLYTFTTYEGVFFKTMLLDREGNFWVGGEGDLIKLSPIAFQTYLSEQSPELTYNFSIAESSDGQILIGSRSGNVLAKTSDGFKSFFQLQPPSPVTIRAIYVDENDWIWYGTNIGGIFLDRNGKVENYRKHQDGISDNAQFFFYKTRNGELWSGGDGGIMRTSISLEGKLLFDNFMWKPDRYDERYPVFQAIIESSIHIPWTGGDMGLFTIKNNQLKQWSFPDPLNPHPVITDLELDSEGNLWISTQGEGLWQCRFNDQDEPALIYQWTTKDGLLSDILFNVHIDNSNRVWVISQSGICCLDFQKTDSTIRCFDKRDGWMDISSPRYQLFESSDSLLWAVGLTGITTFPLYNLPKNEVKPQTFITKIQLFDGKEDIYQYAEHSKQTNFLPQELILPYNKNALRFYFTTTSHTTPEKNKFRYQLTGVDPNWQQAETTRTAFYSNLQAGHYTFKVLSSNNDGIWDEDPATFSFTIAPPWYRSKLAYIIYALLFIGALLFARRQILQRERLKNRIELEQLEKEKVKEIDQLRARFFANISHEFRTPLTLIKAPLEDLLMSKTNTAERILFLQMHQNTERLLHLVNQLLDLSKLESGMLDVQRENLDIHAYLLQLAGNFQSLADKRQLDYQIQIPKEALFLSADRDKIEKIVLNLLSNAFKFAPQYGWVTVKTHFKNRLKISIGNNGDLIPVAEQEKIFERFYQAGDTRHQGAGVGLALVRELVELHQGSIAVESTAEAGTWFTVQLPLEKVKNDITINSSTSTNALATLETIEMSSNSAISSSLERPLLLIVEDHSEVRNYIKSKLQDHFQIVEAENGKAGLAIAVEQMPDLVISDVMMPVLDGVRFCQKIKTDPRTDHIPVILLTAKADIESRLKGLQTGADDYLAKPFNGRELLIRSQNLIEQRRKLQERFQKGIQLLSKAEKTNSVEEQFLQKAVSVVERKLDVSTFTIEDFAQELQLSRVQLHRKLKAITGMSATDFVRTMRLERAAFLLEKKTDTVSQIAFQVGFNNLSYFSKCFKEKYGVSPSAYKKA